MTPALQAIKDALENLHARNCNELLNASKNPYHGDIHMEGLGKAVEEGAKALALIPKIEGSGWQPAETAPRGVPILLCEFAPYKCFVGLKTYNGTFISSIGVVCIEINPSHWQTLPLPPNADKE